MICGGCRASIPDHVKFCPKCGTKAEAVTASANQTKRCPVCGTDNPLSAKFCKAGGHPFPPVEQAPSVAPPMEVKESKDVLSCPTCGTTYPLTAKFCRNDGTLLKGAPVPASDAEQPPMPEGTGRSSESEADPPPLQPGEQEPPKAAQEPNDTLSCPTCGTSYPLTTKFCRNDGTALKGAPAPSPEAAQPPMPEGTEQSLGSEADPPAREEGNQTVPTGVATPPESEETSPKQEVKVSAQPDVVEVGAGAVRRPSRSWLWPAVAGVVLLLVGGAGYLYYAGFFGKDPAKVQMKLDAELKAQGLDDIYVEVSKDWVATVSGFVENEADRGRVLGIVESNNDVKEVEDRITVATTKGSPAKGATESPGAQPPSMWTGGDSSPKAETRPPSAQQPPSMRNLEEALKQGTFE